MWFTFVIIFNEDNRSERIPAKTFEKCTKLYHNFNCHFTTKLSPPLCDQNLIKQSLFRDPHPRFNNMWVTFTCVRETRKGLRNCVRYREMLSSDFPDLLEVGAVIISMVTDFMEEPIPLSRRYYSNETS